MKTRTALLYLAILVPGIVPAVRAADTQPPVIQTVSPAPGSTVSNLSRVIVTFSEPVVGEQAADLIINNDSPAVSLGSTGAVVTFEFSQPHPGTVGVSFDPDTVITDQAGNPFDAFAPAAHWTYTLADTIPPTVAVATPAAGATVRALTQIEVAFAEPVSGVSAADLRINGQAATSLTAVALDRYLFQFPQPGAGSVTISWTGGHGIQDMAPSPNAFGGAGWSYTLNAAAASDVVINEFLTDNLTSLADENEQRQDWIEFYNRGSGTVNLLGWAITDDPADPGKWTFPALTLAAGQYLIVYASGKDRKPTTAGTTNHTSFQLSSAGGYLGLYSPESPRTVISEFAPEYPEQRADVSYGRSAGGAPTYFSTLTPRATNNAASAVSGFAQPPHASVKSGFFNQPFALVLSTETAGAEIRYTVDGKPPTIASTLYTGPLSVAGTPTKAVVLIRASAFKTGLLPSFVTTRSYIFPDHVLTQPANPAGFPSIWDSPCTGFNNCNDINPADYEMDPQVITNAVDNYRVLARQGLVSIPTVSIVTDVNLLFGATEGVYVRREPFLRKPINAEFITTDGTEGFQIDCGLEMQGQTSPDDSNTGGVKWKSLKLGLRLFFQGEFGPTKLKYKVFEDSPVDSFDTLLLGGGHNNYWNYNNNDTQRTRSMYVRDQYVANLQNAMGGLSHHGRFVHLYLNGLYWGLYQMHERPDETYQASYQGGEKEEYDVFKHDSGTLVAGGNTSYTAMWAIINAGLTNNANYELLQQYLDVPGLIDYLLVNFWANNTDWDHKNLYASHRQQVGQWRFHAWDSEHVLAATDFGVLDDNNGSNPTAIFKRLLANTEFRILLADHVHRHFFNGGILYTDPANPIYNAAFPERNRPAARFMSMLQAIDTAIVCESARWGDVGPGRETTPHTRNTSFYEERDILMGYRATFGSHSPTFFPSRSTNLVGQFRTRGWYPNVAAPAFSQHGGRVAAGYSLRLTNLQAGGTIYFTTNGADPRLYGSGAVLPQAVAYSGTPLSVGQSMTVKARTLSGTNWSALLEADFTVGSLVAPLLITEINYNPPGGDAYEFIELRNAGATPLDVSAWTMEGVSYTFPVGTVLAPGATVVLASSANPNLFAARYPGVLVAGLFGGSLNNGGERVAVKDATGRTVISVDYDDENGWPTVPDGGGSTLEMVEGNGDPDAPSTWHANTALQGTPGQGPTTPPTPAIVIHEVMAENLTAVNHADTYPDWIELFNQGGAPVDLTGWSLSDDGDPRKFVFTSGPTLQPGDYLIVWCDATTNTTPGLHTGFALGKGGDNVFLYNASTTRVDGVSFGLQLGDYTLGRVGGAWRLTVPTTNAANVAAMVAAQTNLALNEWLANAPPGGSDWIELYNRAALPVSLQGAHLGTSNALFQLRSLSFLGANSFAQLLADEQAGPSHLDFKLPTTPNVIVLSDGVGLEVDRAKYGAQIEGVTQGRLPDGHTNVLSFAGSASPGATNYVAAYSGPALHEVLAINRGAVTNAAGRAADYVELVNTNGAAASVAGMRLSTDAGDSAQWVFPAGATVPGNGHLVVWCDDERPASIALEATLNTGRSLAGRSGAIYLFNAAGQLVDAVAYGFQVENLPLGRSGGAWRLLASPTPGTANSAPATLAAATGLRVNEWMADPAGGNDWFELFNPGAAPVELSGLYVTDDPSIYGLTQFPIAPLSFIGALGFVKFEADGDPSQGQDHVSFSLDGGGDTIRLYTAALALIDAVDFGLQRPGVSQGRLPDGTTSVVSFPTTATPEASNYLPLPAVVVNEVLPRAVLPATPDIELFNPTLAPLSVGGWFLSDNGRDLKRYRIPNGTSVPLAGFLVIPESQFNSGAATTPFALEPARGGEVWLAEADGGGNLTGYRATARFGAAATNVSIGRHLTSSGTDFTALNAHTFDAANAYPKVGPLVFAELMYHPPFLGGTNDNTVDEFIEIRNTSGASVDLFDAVLPAHRWRLQAGVDFTFPAGISLPAGSNLLVVHFDPVATPALLTAFRTRYGVGSGVPIFGPYSGKLDNEGESVELAQPGAPEPDGFVPYLLIDRVAYSASAPWAAAAGDSTNGLGASLQRVSFTGYGNDATNWIAGTPTAGGPTGPAITPPPAISQHPQNQVGPAGSNVTFSVTATGGAPLQYQWRFSGAPLVDATNATLVISNLQATHEGAYAVLISNPAGSILSRPATLVVGAPPSILQQPQTQAATVAFTVAFTVVATGGDLRHQWRFYGTNLPGATNATLTLVAVQPAQAGPYSCQLTNNSGAILSADAYLVLAAPTILADPQGLTLNAGSPVTFSVTAGGDAPLSYQWRRQGANLAGATAATFMLASAQTNDAGNYTVVVSNPAGAVTSAVATLTILVPAQITQQPRNVSGPAGTNVAFSVGAIGTGTLRYQWWFNGTTLLAGATNSSHSFTNAQVTHNGAYSVVVSDDLASVTSSNAILTILARPTLTVQPTNFLALPGSNAVFFIEATGTLPISVRWRRAGATFTNGIILSTPSNSTLIVTNVQLTNDGQTYNAVLTNIAGQAPVSATATLSVFGPPAWLSQPSSLTVYPGTNVTFSVMATGVGPLRYQWNLNAVALSGRTNTSLSLTNVQVTNEGFYTATVTNRDGTATSTPALLTVVTPPLLSEPQWRGDGQFQFLLQGNIHRSYTIDAATFPPAWTVVGTLNYTNGRMPFVDSTASNALHRIYRARLVP